MYVVIQPHIVHLIHVPQKQDSLTTSPSTIREAAEATAKREIESQKTQFRHFGIMADWSPEFTYRTLGVWGKGSIGLGSHLSLQTENTNFASYGYFRKW